MEVTELGLEDTEIGERFRKEYDLNEDFLATIKEKGIIQPITVSQDLKLVAGGRRLAGAKPVGGDLVGGGGRLGSYPQTWMVDPLGYANRIAPLPSAGLGYSGAAGGIRHRGPGHLLAANLIPGRGFGVRQRGGAAGAA